MKANPIVIIGNGPSIAGFDWSRLDGIDTFCMNSFYRVCESDGYYPTYYGLYRKMPELWGTEPIDFIEKNHSKFKTVFYSQNDSRGNELYSDEFCGLENVVPVIRADPSLIPTFGDKDEWETAYVQNVYEATEKMQERYGVDEIIEMMEGTEQPDEELNTNGIIKWIEGRRDEITEEDLITKQRWRPEFTYAESLSHFRVSDEDSSTQTARIAELIGYNFVILIGMDGKFKVDKNGMVDESSWGIKSVFNGKKLDLSKSIECGVCRTSEKLDEFRKQFWDNCMVSMISVRHPFTVWNCTKGSSLDNIEYHDLDETLKLVRGWNK